MGGARKTGRPTPIYGREYDVVQVIELKKKSAHPKSTKPDSSFLIIVVGQVTNQASQLGDLRSVEKTLGSGEKAPYTETISRSVQINIGA